MKEDLHVIEPKVEIINIITDYIEGVLKKKEEMTKGNLKLNLFSLWNRKYEDIETQSEPKEANQHPVEEGPNSVDVNNIATDYFALFRTENRTHHKQIPSTGFTSFTSEGVSGRIFIDGQCIDNSEALDSVEELNDLKMTLICESICNSGGNKSHRKISSSLLKHD